MPTLTIQLPGQPPVFHVLRDETITIGRLKSNTIVIEDNSVSLMHAKITRKDGQFYLKDLNSTNGTIVNGQPIGEVRLRDQDKVRFAEITTQFLADGEAPMTAASVATPTSAAPAPAAQASPRPAVPAPVSQSSTVAATQPTAPARTPTPSVPTSQKKPAINRRVLLVAAAVVLVALPGIGFVVWKSIDSQKQSAAASPPALVPKAKKEVASVPAKQVPSPKPAVEAKAPEVAETPTAPSNISDLVSALKSKDVAERRQAASGLHGAGADAKDAIPALKEALKDSDSEVQMWAALALVNTQTYDKAIIPILIRSLKNDNAVVRQVACLSLGLISYEPGDKSLVVPALNDAANKDADEEVRKAATSALNIVGAEISTQSAAK